MNKQILRLAIPFIISNITVPLLSTADTALMGNFASTAHLGAIGLGSAIFNFIYWNFAFIKMSMAGMTAQAYGRKDADEMAQLLGRSMVVALMGAVLVMVLQKPLLKASFFLMRGDDEVMGYVEAYYRIRIYAAPATLGMYAIIGWFIGMQNAKAPMFIAIVINALNIGLNFIFVLEFDMKAEGVAWATLISQYSGFLISLLLLKLNYGSILSGLNWNKLWEKEKYLNFVNVNKDVFVRTFVVMTVLTYFNFVSANQGALVLGMNVIFLQLIYAFSFFVDGFANAAEALVGKFVGSRDLEQLRFVVRRLFYWGVGIAIAFTLIYILFWPYVIRIYTSDTAILQEAGNYIIWIIGLPLISITAFIWDGVFLGATATVPYRNATFVAAATFFLVFYLLRGTYGNHALLLAQLLFFGLRGLIQTFYYKSAILGQLK